MSLDVDYTRIADWKTLHADADALALSETLAFAALAVGLSSITKKNATVWRARLIAMDCYASLTLDQITRRIGLATNVTNETDHHFAVRLGTNLMREAEHRVVAEAKREGVPL